MQRDPSLQAAILRCILDFRYLAIEGPIGVGKTVLARHLGLRLDAATILEETDNPFIADLYSGRPGAAFQAQLFSLLARHRQQAELRQTDLFSQVTISDYLFDKDKIYAYLNLDDNELFIYQRLYDLLAADVVAPDLVVYLQATSDVLRRRARHRRQRDATAALPDDDYLGELNDAYNHSSSTTAIRRCSWWRRRSSHSIGTPRPWTTSLDSFGTWAGARATTCPGPGTRSAGLFSRRSAVNWFNKARTVLARLDCARRPRVAVAVAAPAGLPARSVAARPLP